MCFEQIYQISEGFAKRRSNWQDLLINSFNQDLFLSEEPNPSFVFRIHCPSKLNDGTKLQKIHHFCSHCYRMQRFAMGYSFDKYVLKNDQISLFSTKSLTIGAICMAPFLLITMCIICGCCKNEKKVSYLILQT